MKQRINKHEMCLMKALKQQDKTQRRPRQPYGVSQISILALNRNNKFFFCLPFVLNSHETLNN